LSRRARASGAKINSVAYRYPACRAIAAKTRLIHHGPKISWSATERLRRAIVRDSKALFGQSRGIRITPNVYTTLSELDRFCDQMETIARHGLST
jgi:selenocysteine lyase/cysteine desulfurase